VDLVSSFRTESVDILDHQKIVSLTQIYSYKSTPK